MDSRNALHDDGADEALLDKSGDNSGSSAPIFRSGLRWSIDGRRLLFATCACLAAASLFGLLSVMIWVNQSKSQRTLDNERQRFETIVPTNLPPTVITEPEPEHDKWGPLAALRGPPTESFRGEFALKIYRVMA